MGECTANEGLHLPHLSYLAGGREGRKERERERKGGGEERRDGIVLGLEKKGGLRPIGL